MSKICIHSKIKEESNFTKDQLKAYDMFFEFMKNKKEKMFVISGGAGNGKTFTISKIIQALEFENKSYKVATFTGKASSVLQNKGVCSQTIHSLMYTPLIDDETGEIFGWKKSDSLECELLIIDEYSMLTEELINDIMDYRIKVLFCGDGEQLPPVGTDYIYLSTKTNVELTETVRQAKDNPIIKYATKVRNGEFLQAGIFEKNEHGVFMTISKNDINIIEKAKEKVDVIICGTNIVRHKLNLEYRIKNNIGVDLVVGEKIIVLKNNKQQEVYNGEILEVKKIGRKYKDACGFICVDVETDVGVKKICYDMIIKPDYDYSKHLFQSNYRKIKKYKEPLFTNSAVAITTHKMQGSEADSILVFANDLTFIADRNKENGRNLLKRAIYTAITRAKKNCVVVI